MFKFSSCRAWVPNLFETMSHCPIDDREMSHCAIAHSTYLFTEVKFQGLPVYLIYKPEILNFESGEYLGSPPQGKNFEKTLQIKKCESRKCTLIDSCWTGRISLVSQVVRLNYESMRNAWAAPPLQGKNFQTSLKMEKWWMILTYCVTSGAGSRNTGFRKLSFLSQKT